MTKREVNIGMDATTGVALIVLWEDDEVHQVVPFETDEEIIAVIDALSQILEEGKKLRAEQFKDLTKAADDALDGIFSTKH